MEFPFDLNQLFSERVSILDQTLVGGRNSTGRPHLQAQIATVIDELGTASAKAQQLPASITSASKLQSQKHQLYLLKDGERNGGRGAALGFLKVGYKKLFLLDQQGVHVEAEPLCVLDFYIAENLQRHGYGLELFDFMLQHKNLEPVLMAYDRPSPKFLSFLSKHYCLTPSVPQANNFVVFDGFFLNRSAAMLRKVPLKKPDGEIKPYSLMEREVVRREQRARPWPFAPPHSPQRSVSSQCSHSHSVGSSPSRAPLRAAPASAPGGFRDQSPQCPLVERCRAKRTSQQGLVARRNLYSRHMDGRAVGLLDRPLPGLRPVGDQSLGYTDTHRLASIHTAPSRFRPFSLPPLFASKKDGICSQTGAETQLDSDAEACGVKEEIRVLDNPQRPQHQGRSVNQRHVLDNPQRPQHQGRSVNERYVLDSPQRPQHQGRSVNQTHVLDSPQRPQHQGRSVNQRHVLEKERDRFNPNGSWTVGENCYTALWVKQKQEHRSTRPW